MSRDRKIVVILAIALFLACVAIVCLVGLLAGGAWIAMSGRRVEVPLQPFEREFRDMPGPREPWEGPQRMQVAVLVINIVEDGPAAEAGLRMGDMIVAVDGESITPETDLKEFLSTYKPGDRIKLTVRRGEQERNVQVKLGRHPQQPNLPYLGLTYRLVPIEWGDRRIRPD
jgi:S1-C subfamily serine protease